MRDTIRDDELNWWREGRNEVDFVVSWGEDSVGIEVKSGRVKSTGGLTAFALQFPHARTMVVGSAACSIESFLLGEHDLFLVVVKPIRP